MNLKRLVTKAFAPFRATYGLGSFLPGMASLAAGVVVLGLLLHGHNLSLGTERMLVTIIRIQIAAFIFWPILNAGIVRSTFRTRLWAKVNLEMETGKAKWLTFLMLFSVYGALFWVAVKLMNVIASRPIGPVGALFVTVVFTIAVVTVTKYRLKAIAVVFGIFAIHLISGTNQHLLHLFDRWYLARQAMEFCLWVVEMYFFAGICLPLAHLLVEWAGRQTVGLLFGRSKTKPAQ
jgi:hypothetical protein